MMGWYGDYGMFGSGFGMALTMILVWAVLVAIVVMLVRLTVPSNRSDSTEGRPDPKTILDERFARGELEEDEYRARKTALGGKR